MDDFTRLGRGGKQQVELRPESIGYEMCDRDIKFTTCTMDAFASLNVPGALVDGDVDYTAVNPGEQGNAIKVEHKNSGSGGLQVALIDGVVVVDFGGVTTASLVKAAVNANPEVAQLVSADTPGTGLLAPGILAETNLAGGSSSSIEDMKMNPFTFKEEGWKEARLVNVYKLVGNDMVPCSNQADADINGILSVMDYFAVDQQDGVTPIPYEIRDGNIYIDDSIIAGEMFDHRAYAIAVPSVPGILGGSVSLFDGYLGPLAGKVLQATSPTAKRLDPANGPGTTVIRFYFIHPSGSKKTHIVRLVTYRPTKTF